MAGSRHAQGSIEEFLDAEFRQVWAVHRRTGEAQYLDVGRADEVRALAKREWRCPVPGCEVQISTRGKSRRDHFFHNEPSPHTSDGESEFHLAAKAMLADWAKAQAPASVEVAEEQFTEKHPETSRYRIADVMLSWGAHNRMAFEVEYKNYAPDAWSLKQRDYEAHEPNPVTCIWILGHTRLKRPPKNSYAASNERLVRIPLLGRAWIASGRPLLAINPVTRCIGTILDMHRPDAFVYPSHGSEYGTLQVDLLEDCTLDPVRGLVSPTMKRVDLAENARRRQAEERERIMAHQAQAHTEKLARIELMKADQLRGWRESELKAVIEGRWEQIPSLLTNDYPADMAYGVWAHPTHWHAAIYEDLIHGKPASSSFSLTAVYGVIDKHQIRLHYDKKVAFLALIRFMERLQRHGILAIAKANNRYTFTLTGTTILQAETQHRQRAARKRAEREAAETKREEVRAVNSSTHGTYRRPGDTGDRCVACDGFIGGIIHRDKCVRSARAT